MSDRIISANYDAETKVSYVKKSSRWGIFEGYAKCQPEDSDIASEFIGCDFAEYKCDIKIQKERTDYYRARYDGIKMVYNNLLNKWGQKNPVMVSLYHQLQIAKKDYDFERDYYKVLKENYKPYVDTVIQSHKDLLKVIQRKES